MQSSLLGSIISNLLLVMGLCFVLSDLYNKKDANGKGAEQNFASSTGQLTSTLMTLASASMILPAAVSLSSIYALSLPNCARNPPADTKPSH